MEKVQQILQQSGLDAFIVGSGDAHQSEYVHESDMRRAFISHFIGSSGTALILSKPQQQQHPGYLWTDGRYFLQASRQLQSPTWQLMRSGEAGVLEINDWILENLPSGSVVGVDPFLVAASTATAMEKQFKAKSITLRATTINPIDVVWNETASRPSAPCGQVIVHSLPLAGQRYQDKIQQVQKQLEQKQCSALVVSMLDEIAWLFNIRGDDVAFNPVVVAYAVVTVNNGSHLFVDEVKLSKEVKTHLVDVTIHPYQEITSFLTSLSTTTATTTTGNKIFVDPSQLNWKLFQTIPASQQQQGPSPITLLKAVKNESEINGIRNAHIRDGVALTAFLAYLERTILNNNNNNGGVTNSTKKSRKNTKSSAVDNSDNNNNSNNNNTEEKKSLTEYEVVEKLLEFRQRFANLPVELQVELQQLQHHVHKFVSPSFATIAGYANNGAIIHYKPSPEDAAVIGTDSFFLLDSGGQYLDGTTDVTRTVHFGEPTEHMRDCYTRVLKGHIQLATAVFPEGTMGTRLDSIARQPLWQVGLDYNHGTGHGVGAFLNVHEGPQGIGFRHRPNEAGFVAGMTISNEPGYYQEANSNNNNNNNNKDDNGFGIRIETVCVAVKKQFEKQLPSQKQFLGFETVTMVPIATGKLLNLSLLTDDELSWLNSYHQQVREKLLPLMKVVFPEAVDFLIRETEPVVRSTTATETKKRRVSVK